MDERIGSSILGGDERSPEQLLGPMEKLTVLLFQQYS